MKNKLGVILLLVMLVSGCGRQPVDPGDYRSQIEKWHTERFDRLKSRKGWLNLAGLYWLQEGLNPFGSDTTNAIVFPSNAPPFIGVLELKNDSVFLRSSQVPLLVDSIAVTSALLRTDATGNPSLISVDSLAWHIIKRGDRYGIRLRDYASPLVRELKDIPCYETSQQWRIIADYKAFDKPRIQKVQTVIGMEVENTIPGELTFRLQGKKMKLYPVVSSGEWSIVFGDKTNGEDTYAAGRFLDIEQPDGNNKVIIDFNKAYNPPCAFTPFATCQLPHRNNMLPVRVEAGEKAVHISIQH